MVWETFFGQYSCGFITAEYSAVPEWLKVSSQVRQKTYLQHMRSLSPPDGSGLGHHCSAAPRVGWPCCGPVASSLTQASGCWFADECFDCWFGLKEKGTSKRHQLSVHGRQKMREDGQIDHFLQLSLDMTSLALCRENPFFMPVISHSPWRVSATFLRTQEHGFLCQF